MKKILAILTFSLLSIFSLKAQYLSLDQLITFRKYSVASLEENLTARNWTFTDATEETDKQLGMATFAYERDAYETDKAKLFLTYLYSSNDGTKRISYQCLKPTEYSKLVTRAKDLGFTLYKTDIKDECISKFYKKGELIIRFESTKDTQDYKDVTLYTVFILTYSDWLNMLE